MRPSILQRPSICLFCALARPRPLARLLPQVQRAYRAGGKKWKASRDKSVDSGAGGEKYPWSIRRTSPVNGALERLQRDIEKKEFLDSIGLARDQFDQIWTSFCRYVRASPWLVDARDNRRRTAVDMRLRHLFYAQVFGGRFTQAEVNNQKELADLRHPAEWFPATRAMLRTVHLHVGPTNSGKTYHALKRLEEAESGIYLGPLRLLAHEVYTRMNAQGKPCALVTGEEQRLPENAQLWSCTVEMAPFNQQLDVAVIDEIQMINDKDRGWAWTQAVLGLQARELHLCGEARTVPLIRELCALVGDKLVVHEYQRLTPLRPMDKSLGGNLIKNLQKGDCVVSFSVLSIHALRKEIESKTGRKCAIVYGSLPPETRAQQARLFNDPDNDYDFLVASNAIGMGLNLSIKRVIFESTMRSNGEKLVPLDISEVKQIAGRAGRYRTAHQAVSTEDANNGNAQAENATIGYATTLETFDYKYFKSRLEAEPEAIKTGGLFPPAHVVERFAGYFPPDAPFSYILLRLHELAEMHPRFHLCSLKDQLKIADAIHAIKNLTIQDRLSICAAPTSLKTPGEQQLLKAMASCIAEGKSSDFLDLPIPLEVLDKVPSADKEYLGDLELLHKMVVLYLWLSYRFPHVFQSKPLANHAKTLVEEAIEKTLNEFSYTEKARKRLVKLREQAMKELETAGEEEEAPLPGDAVAETEKELPQEAIDILHDKKSFASSGKTSDDVDEYPTPEIELDGLRKVLPRGH